jgi:hypothetical protein
MKLRDKNIILLLFIVLLMVISYFFAIKKTIDLSQTYEELLSNKKNSEEYALSKVKLETKRDSLQNVLGGFKNSSVYLQNKLLVKLDKYSKKNKVKIVSIEEPFKFEINDVVINYFRFTLQGDYVPMAKTLNQIETGSNFGEIVSLQFKKERDRRRRNVYLQVEAILKTSL